MFGKSRNGIHTEWKQKMHVSPFVTLARVQSFFSSSIQNWATVSTLHSSFETTTTITTEGFYKVKVLGLKTSALLLSCFIPLHKVLIWCHFLSCNNLSCVLQGQHYLSCVCQPGLQQEEGRTFPEALEQIHCFWSVFFSPDIIPGKHFSLSKPLWLPRTPFQS